MHRPELVIRTVPSNTNPTPRPNTPGRPGTSSGLHRPSTSSSSSLIRTSSGNRSSFQVFDSDVPEKSVFDDMITEEYLQKVAGTDDLQSVTEIKLSIDTSYQSLLDIGDMLKRLDCLTLDGSKIASVRDLGVGLKYLISLSVNDCGLSELDGIGMLTSLKELSARDNNIEDVTALALHETIETIDLHGNMISDISVADTLSSCPKLHYLILSGNSIERAPKYKLVVASMIPQLVTLDGDSVDDNAKNKVSNGMILEAASAMQLEQEELDDERRMEMALMGDDMFFESNLSSLEATSHDQKRSSSDNNSCSLPDNGSDLTHGSSVVLAGSMASAIRRRRNDSPRASSSGSQDHNSDHSSVMSTLATLDYASKTVGNEKHELFLGEGDITKAMIRQGSSPKSSQFRKQKKSLSVSMDVNTSSTSSGHTPKNLSNPIATAIISAAHSQNATSFEYDSSEERQKTKGVSGTSPAGWASRPLSRKQSRRSNTSRSPSPSGEGRLPPTSPPAWQRNASRPQSNASSGRGTAIGIAGGIAPSAPFKVSSQDKECIKSPHGSPSSSSARKNSKDSLPNLSRRQVDKGGSMWGNKNADDVYCSSSDDEEFRGRNQRKGVGPPNSSGGVSSKKKGTASVSVSAGVVKKDNVLRGLLFSDEPDATKKESANSSIVTPGIMPSMRETGYSFDYKSDEEDNEDIAVDHKSRHELMRSKQKEKESFRSKQKQMMTFSQVADDSHTSPRASMHSSHSHKSSETDTDVHESSINLSENINPHEQADGSVSGKQLSEVATRSLGFDLKGSLAAINQWVDDQDSDEEEDGEEEDEPISSKYGDVWSMRKEMKRATTAQKTILSRDKILGMCTGNYDDAVGPHPGTRLTANNLAMNEIGAQNYSYDQGDEDESDCEENVVMFYDNNIEQKSDSLSKSCSLLTIGGFGNTENNDENNKKLMSMSLKVKPTSTSTSPRAKKKTISSEIESTRECTPSTSIDVAQVSTTPSRSTIETEVRSSPSNDAPTGKTSKHKKKTTEKVKISVTSDSTGAALSLSDEQLIHMLSQPPKAVPALKTKSGFQDFFRGMQVGRMRQLLSSAYQEMAVLDREQKVKKRMELLDEVLLNESEVVT